MDAERVFLTLSNFVTNFAHLCGFSGVSTIACVIAAKVGTLPRAAEVGGVDRECSKSAHKLRQHQLAQPVPLNEFSHLDMSDARPQQQQDAAIETAATGERRSIPHMCGKTRRAVSAPRPGAA